MNWMELRKPSRFEAESWVPLLGLRCCFNFGSDSLGLPACVLKCLCDGFLLFEVLQAGFFASGFVYLFWYFFLLIRLASKM